MKRTKQKQFFGKKFEKCLGDKKKTWNCMKDIMFYGQKSKNPTNLFTNIDNDEDKQNKLNNFNEFYSTIGDHFVSSNSNNFIQIPEKLIENNVKFDFKEITLDETKKIIMGLKNKHSSGYDEISPILVKICCDELAPFIQILINKSLSSGKMPEDAKLARVIGIYKAGSIDDVSNFRPISVTPVFGKLIEIVADSQLSTYMENNKILSKEQYGFRTKSNTLSACFDLVSNVCKNRDEKKITCLTFVDTKKAFNSVNRQLLIRKLNNFGFSNQTLNWFKSFLSYTRQYSECENKKSKILEVKTGLMQGSILSPKLFNLYSCDLNLMSFSGTFYAFADDICFEHHGETLSQVELDANNDMKKFENYMNYNFLTVNIDKSKCLTIGNTASKAIINYANQSLENVIQYKYLGLIINERLDWNNHISKLSNGLSTLTGVFGKIARVLPNDLKKSLYHSMFVSHVLYCISIYGSTSNTNILLLQRIQNKALKRLYQKDLTYSPRRLLNELNYHSIMNYYRIFATSHIHAIKLGQIHTNMELHFSNHLYETRNKTKLWLPQIHSQLWGENNPYIKGISIYNNLDECLKQQDYISFKKCIKVQFLET
jgi:hypothetical protein